MFIYGLALILSFVKYKYYYETRLKALPIIIGYVLLTEVLGYIISEYEEIQIVYEEGLHYYNHFIYNILDIVLFIYFFWIFQRSISADVYKNFIIYGVILFLIATLLNPFFQDFTLYPQLGSIGVGSILLITCSVLYLLQLVANQSKLSNYNLLLKWISIGIILLYPFYPAILYIGQVNEVIFFELNLRSVLGFLIVLMYSCISIGLIKLKKVI